MTGNGYIGQSMSVNAKIERENGGRPLHEWTKSDILSEIRLLYGEKAEKHAEKLSLAELRENALSYAGWHHTGKYFHKTDFYELKQLDEEEILSWEHIHTERKPKEKPIRFVAHVRYTKWTGSRKHPHAEEKEGIAVWASENGHDSLAKVYTEGDYPVSKRVSSLRVVEHLKRFPGRREKLYRFVESGMKYGY